jgi:hypothetical protein
MRLLLVFLVAGCGGQVQNGASELRAAATTALPTLSFGADWSVTQSAPVVSGGKATVHYDIARQPRCRTWYMGQPAWDIEARWSSDGGIEHAQPVTAVVNGQRVGVDITIDVPPGHDLALWFHNSDESGCSDWDSNYGRNFHFALAPGAPALHFAWPGWSWSVDGAPAAGGDLVVDYDIRRQPYCRQDYNGLQTWDVTVGYRFDGGAAASASLTTTPTDYQRVQAPARLTVPAGARAMELWFENHDRTGCQTWDSSYGNNYRVTLR